MRKRTTFNQRLTARQQRALRRARVYRWPFYPNEEAQHRIAPLVIGAALSDPAKGMHSLSCVGVSFTRWQKWRIRFALWLGKPGWAQKIVLKTFR